MVVIVVVENTVTSSRNMCISRKRKSRWRTTWSTTPSMKVGAALITITTIQNIPITTTNTYTDTYTDLVVVYSKMLVNFD